MRGRDHVSFARGLRKRTSAATPPARVGDYFAASQSGPTPTSTASGGSSSKAVDHLPLGDLGRRVHLRLGSLEEQLVVDLEDELGLEPGVGERASGSGPSPA